MKTDEPKEKLPLTKDRILLEAMRMADEYGIEYLSMRKLGKALGVEAMSIYHHFKNKDEIIVGLIDLIHEEVVVQYEGATWREAMYTRAHSLLAALLRHPWSPALMESKFNRGPATLRQAENVIKCLTSAGFSIEQTAHIYSILDSYIYGFGQQHISLPFESSEEAEGVALQMMDHFPMEEYPNLAQMLSQHVMQPGYDNLSEFEFGINLILDGVAQLSRQSPS